MSKLTAGINKIKGLSKSKLASNSIWGVASSAVQSILLSLFFVILARQYSTDNFAHFLIANTVYQLLAAFSSLGLGQWFTREIVSNEHQKLQIVSKFLKMQLYSGLFFYVVSLVVAFILYKEIAIRNLILVLGINIVFDNVIYGIKNLNVAEFRQNKTMVVLTVDSVLKFLIATLLYIYPFSVLILSTMLIVARFITLNFFLAFGSSKLFGLKDLIRYKLSFKEVKELIAGNWSFIVIGSASVVYWRFSNIIISKLLTLKDVAHFEISYRIFSIVQILPFVVAVSVFPSLVKWYKEGNLEKFRAHYYKIFDYYLLYSVFMFTFFYAFSDAIVPWAFGPEYAETPRYTKEMFLTILIFPTAIMQATVLVAMNLEKIDMWLNVLSLVLNLGASLIILQFVSSLSVINYAIFGSFLVFHICQDYMLVKKGLLTISHALKFYVSTVLLVGIFMLIQHKLPGVISFSGFWIIVLLLMFMKAERRIFYKLNLSR